MPSVFTPLSHKLPSSFQFTANDISSVLRKLDPNKSHGHNMLSICTIKFCADSIYKPLEMILNLFKSCLNQ